ncbi:hypothetical protein [Methylobacterium oryzihabitans]|uniref:Antibiotic ABC transporter n=1 Tax=Methylobacterium oryzihabitans TaxID=2499852 RepID=A0A437PFM9_9HYPH|nr:hypothetical protein [Methylobacterium oryzihabitans]RVU21077.1 hypothetical protein EOE48_02985 [Methylobacterium oryzihabitans]
MFGPWMQLGLATTQLAFEAQTVIAMRLAKLSLGGPAAGVEAQRMVSEKVMAAMEAAATLATGGSASTVVKDYRRHVRANARRLRRG